LNRHLVVIYNVLRGRHNCQILFDFFFTSSKRFILFFYELKSISWDKSGRYVVLIESLGLILRKQASGIYLNAEEKKNIIYLYSNVVSNKLKLILRICKILFIGSKMADFNRKFYVPALRCN
jgi:hypothetical protein